MTPLITELVKYAPEPESAMWFDLGKMERMDATRVSADVLFNLPFKRTAIAASDKEGIKFSLWLMEGDQSLTIAGFTLEGGGVRYINPTAVLVQDNQLRYYSKGKQVPESEVKSLIRMTLACLMKLQGMDTVYRPTIQQTLINAKRKRKGKKPLISWHTVKIEPPSEKREHQGGTHASPRLHDRRGHWRTYKSGKRVFIKACKVGDASKGLVFKDYEVAQAPHQQSSQ
jgi:hypothetical protein